jgi:hypothetical protein
VLFHPFVACLQNGVRLFVRNMPGARTVIYLSRWQDCSSVCMAGGLGLLLGYL